MALISTIYVAMIAKYRHQIKLFLNSIPASLILPNKAKGKESTHRKIFMKI
jgi:hypothetical protein